MLRNIRGLKTRLRLLCNKLSMAQKPEPRFKTPFKSYVTFRFLEWRITVVLYKGRLGR